MNTIMLERKANPEIAPWAINTQVGDGQKRELTDTSGDLYVEVLCESETDSGWFGRASYMPLFMPGVWWLKADWKFIEVEGSISLTKADVNKLLNGEA